MYDLEQSLRAVVLPSTQVKSERKVLGKLRSTNNIGMLSDYIGGRGTEIQVKVNDATDRGER